MTVFYLPPDRLQPSQLYIHAGKLARVQAQLDPARTDSIDPLPVKELDGRLVLTDGHTRALVGLLAGWHELPVAWDNDDLDWEAYRVCVRWCLDAGISSPADLRDRVVNAESYEHLWYDRCRAMQADLAQKRGQAGQGAGQV